MDLVDKKMSVEKQTLSETPETMLDLDENINHELLVLVNVLLHASYQFVLLRSVADSLNMQGSSWIMEKRDNRCRDSVVNILTWIEENNGYLEFADITKPIFDDSQLDGPFFFDRWDEVEKWIREKIVDTKGKIIHSHYEKKTEVIAMLESVLSYILYSGYY